MATTSGERRLVALWTTASSPPNVSTAHCTADSDITGDADIGAGEHGPAATGLCQLGGLGPVVAGPGHHHGGSRLHTSHADGAPDPPPPPVTRTTLPARDRTGR